jgi:D-3-phosphoglycerate dehydrogenase / 2-oxoglutarate reductase
VAKRAAGLGMRVVAYDPYITRRRAEGLGVELREELATLLAEADFLTVHTPLTDETRGMIGEAELFHMPSGAVVVNAARGGIVDEGGLLAALERGHLRAAGLDVFEHEPPPTDHPLLQRDDVVLSAHLGANTIEAQRRVGSEILERTVAALRGDLSRGAVNAPALAPEVVKALGRFLELGEALGTMASQLAPGRVRELEVEFSGTFAVDPDPIATAVTKGFLEPILDEPPNYINAAAIAKERDIRVSRVSAARGRGYTQHVLVTARGAEVHTEIGGTVLGEQPRIVSIENYPIEIRPEGTMLICTNYDRPGAIGKVGTVLGDAGINISGMQLSRVNDDGLAMFAVTLDQVPPDSVLDVLRSLSNVIHSLRVVRF